MRLSTSAFLVGAFSLLLLSACSSGDGGGASKADITTDNYKDLAVAAAEASKQVSSLDNNQAASFSSFLKPSNNRPSASTFAKLTRQIQQATQNCTAGGTFSVPDSFLFGSLGGSTLNNVTFQMNNCDNADGEGAISGTFTFNGDIISGNFSITVSNATIPSEGISNFSGTVVCTANGSLEPNCTFDNIAATNDFTGGIDNRTYSVSNAIVSGNAVDGFTVSATVTDPDHGNIDFTAQGISFNCPDGQPGTGNITIIGDNNTTATVTFNNCTDFTVSSGGLSDTFSWSSI